MRRALLSILLVSVAAASCGRPARSPHRRVLETEAAPAPPPGGLALPNERGSVRFAVVGDSGWGSAGQYELAQRMAEYRERSRFDFVLLLGDNVNETPASPRAFEMRFERPFEPLLRAGVEFYAVLGNHDDPAQTTYVPFHMGGHRYYSFEKTGGLAAGRPRARFLALDTNRLDAAQRSWLARELASGRADWTICFFHHPVYSAGRYATWWLRRQLEPLLVRGGVDAVFSGHDHLYARLEPQNGVQYFVSGGGSSVRAADFRPGGIAVRGYDADLHFVLVEITRDALHFQAVSRTGQTVDAGLIRRHEAPK
jgi:hypothetical protein